MSIPSKYTYKEGKLSVIVNYIEETINLDDIIYLQSSNKKSYIYMKKIGHLTTYMSMRQLYDQLPRSLFVRVNKSYVISVKEILDIENNYVIMSDYRKIKVTKTYQKSFNKVYQISLMNNPFDAHIIKSEIEKYHIFDMSPLAMCIVEIVKTDKTNDFRYWYVNYEYAFIFNKKDPSELVGKTYAELFDEKDNAWVSIYSSIYETKVLHMNIVDVPGINKKLFVLSYKMLRDYYISFFYKYL